MSGEIPHIPDFPEEIPGVKYDRYQRLVEQQHEALIRRLIAVLASGGGSGRFS